MKIQKKRGLNKFVAKQVGFGKKILDIGCAEGKLGKYLRRQKGAVVFGVDISSKAIKEAKKSLDGAYRLDIETEALPFLQKSFDVIICADVLEHLYDPLAVLKKLKIYLKDKGIFVLSIPNIANIKVRWRLLWGKFDYEESGIMDYSHIRFFTKKSALNLMRKAGIKALRIDYSPGFSFFFFQGRVIRFKILKTLHSLLTKLAPTLFCRQFIIIAQL
ncbi:methyltransferase domain-containing protein [Patescibacteria group bacterium]|nr:methyltransferase domain-containing protein [Patescibacteria group bacterium]